MRIANNVDDWEWIVFDIDGVLIDVSGSYDLAVLETATMFLEKFGIGYDLSLQLIRILGEREPLETIIGSPRG